MVLSIDTSSCTKTETHNLPIVNAAGQKDNYVILGTLTMLQTEWLQLYTKQIFRESSFTSRPLATDKPLMYSSTILVQFYNKYVVLYAEATVVVGTSTGMTYSYSCNVQ